MGRHVKTIWSIGMYAGHCQNAPETKPHHTKGPANFSLDLCLSFLPPIPFSLTRSYLLSQPLEIPPIDGAILPHPDLSVVDLLQFDIPTQANVHLIKRAKDCFSRQEPNESLNVLRMRMIPPKEWLADLGRSIRPAIAQGARSLIDPRYPNSHLHLCAYTYWKEGAPASRKRAMWEEVISFLSKCSTIRTRSNCAAEIPRAVDVLRGLGWSQSLHAVGLGVGLETLTPLLAEDHDGPGFTDTVIVAPTHFANGLKCYQALFTSPNTLLKVLYLPAHVNEEHWIPIQVDIDC